MKRILLFLSPLLALAASVDDVKVTQMTNASPPAYADRFTTPTALSLWGFDASKRPVDILLGPNLSITGTTLNVVGAGTGTVTSVALALPPIFTVSGSPVTGAGTLAATLANENANLVWAGPASGPAAPPTFRALVANDIPALPYQPAGTYVTAVSGSAPIASSGGTTPAISIPRANGTGTDGYLASSDFIVFNNKQPAGAYLTGVTADLPLSGAGTSANHLTITQSNAVTNGYLSAADWNTFNNKEDTLTFTSPLSRTTNTVSLLNTAVTPGSYTSANITVDAKGRITAASNGSGGGGGGSPGGSPGQIQYNNAGSFGGFTMSGDATQNTSTGVFTLANTSVTPGSYTNANITVDSKGRVTAAASGSPGGVTSVTASAPLASSGGTTPNISIPVATSSANGYLSSTDWSTFNSKQPAGAYLTSVTADAPLSGSGTSGSHLVISLASTSTNGYLSSTDWNTFNGKQSAGNYITALTGDVTASGPGSVAATLATVNSNTGSWGSATQAPQFTVNGKGLVTGVANVTVTPALSSLIAATGANTIANGNNTGQVWNWANTTNSTSAFTFGETTAATNGTSTSGVPNQVLLKLSTLASSTESPLSVYSRGNHVFSVSRDSMQLLAANGTSSVPTYSFSNSPAVGMRCISATNLGFSVNGTKVQVTDSIGWGYLSVTSDDTVFNSVATGLSVVGNSHTDRHSFALMQASSSDPVLTSLAGKRSRGSLSSPSVITTGDALLGIGGYGYVGATNTYLPAAQIIFASTGTIADTTSGIGGQIKFYTTLAGTDTSPQLGATIEGGSTPKLTSVGPVVHAAYTVATLPAASSYTYGIVAVSDATNAAGTGLGTAPTGGGSVKRMVYSDGTNWLLL